MLIRITLLLVILSHAAFAGSPSDNPREVNTFSIVAYDPATGELGVAVQSRFFTVGNVVPWAKAGVGTVATQAYANTSFGWRGLELLEAGLNAQEAVDILIRTDDGAARRQLGIVDASGNSATYTGIGCSDWAGGRRGENYAVQGNILAGEEVVAGMEEAFLTTEGTLAERLYAALLEGEANGGDSRGKQSAALLVVKKDAGYGGFTDRAIDIRVDDHPEPFKELGRLLKLAQTNYAWNEAWTLFTQKKFEAAVPAMERAAKLAPEYAEVLYDLACIKLAVGATDEALAALDKAVGLNPKLAVAAGSDGDLKSLRGDPRFEKIVNSATE